MLPPLGPRFIMRRSAATTLRQGHEKLRRSVCVLSEFVVTKSKVMFLNWIGRRYEGVCRRLGRGSEHRGHPQYARPEWSPRRATLHAADVQILRPAVSYSH